MTDNSLTITLTVDRTPQQVFDAITNIRGWWTGEIEGSSDALGDEFIYSFQELHRSTQRVTAFIPGERLVWNVTESHLSFVTDHAEWTGTDIIFELRELGDGTELRFTHAGLVADIECFDQCVPAWNYYIGESLRDLTAQVTA